MKNSTRLLFMAFVSQIALINAAPAGAETTFTVEPSVQQTLFDKMSEGTDFLGKINLQLVDEIKGEKLGLSASGPVMSRTATTADGAERKTSDPSALEAFGYECVKCDFDTHLLWSKLDAWAKFPNFQVRIQNHLIQAYKQDLMRVGFNGTSSAATTNKATNPLLQDVAKGWLQHIREDKPTAVMDEVVAASGKVYFGSHASNEYKNLDAVVMDAKNELIPEWNRDAGLVAIVGSALLDDKYFNVVNQDHAPTEANAAEIILASRRLGGLPAYQVPFFPADKILITTFDNLSIYEQETSRRRHIKSKPEKNCEQDFQSSNLAWVVEDYDLACLIENLERRDAA